LRHASSPVEAPSHLRDEAALRHKLTFREFRTVILLLKRTRPRARSMQPVPRARILSHSGNVRLPLVHSRSILASCQLSAASGVAHRERRFCMRCGAIRCYAGYNLSPSSSGSAQQIAYGVSYQRGTFLVLPEFLRGKRSSIIDICQIYGARFMKAARMTLAGYPVTLSESSLARGARGWLASERLRARTALSHTREDA
jgi:hypothetical protein